MQTQQNITRYIIWFAGMVIIIMTIIFPLGYFFISYYNMRGILETEVEINSRLITRIISVNPDIWEFQHLRIQEPLMRRPSIGDAEIRRVFNTKNELVAESVDELDTPFIMYSGKLFDSGVMVGRIEIYRSLRPLLIRTGLVTLITIPIGFGIFLILYYLPIHTIHRMEDKLQKSEERFRELYDSAPVGYHEYDLKGRITNVNRTDLEMLGYTCEEMIGEYMWKFNVEEEIAHQQILAKLSGTLPPGQNLERTYRRKDGTTFPVLIQDRLILDEKGQIKGIRCIIQDITEPKKVEGQLKEYTESLEVMVKERTKGLEEALQVAEALSRVKSDFISNMSHELRTPLNAVIGFSEVIINGMAGPLTDRQKEYLGDILSSGKHLLELINAILDFSQVETGGTEVKMSRFPLREVLNKSTTIFSEKAMKHNIRLNLEIEPDADIEVEADEDKVALVCSNLLSNAIKFTPDGGSVYVNAQRVRGEEKTVSELDTDSVKISVVDTGIGMSEEDQKKLFQPFQQVEAVLTKKYPGIGLGLILCKRYIELHGGKIWVESEIGKGSKFAFTIPLGQRVVISEQ